MVMYEVGFKCPDCARKRPSHMTRVGMPQFGLVGLFSLGTGYVYGWLHPWLMGIGVFRVFGIPVVAFLLAYWLGRGVGGGLQRIVKYKINPLLGWMAVLGGLTGLLLAGPFLAEVLAVLEVVGGASNNPYLAGTSSVLYLLGPGLRLLGACFFLRGVYRAFRP